jgi:hypothetical protein
LQTTDFFFSLLNRETQPVMRHGPGYNIPELWNILDGNAEWFFTGQERFERANPDIVHFRRGLHGSEKKIRIDQNGHLSTIWIQAGPADSLIGEGRRIGMAVCPFHEFACPSLPVGDKSGSF